MAKPLALRSGSTTVREGGRGLRVRDILSEVGLLYITSGARSLRGFAVALGDLTECKGDGNRGVAFGSTGRKAPGTREMKRTMTIKSAVFEEISARAGTG